MIKNIALTSGAIISGGALLTTGLLAFPVTGPVGLMALGYTSVGALYGTAVAGELVLYLTDWPRLTNQLQPRNSLEILMIYLETEPVFFLHFQLLYLGVLFYMMRDDQAPPSPPVEQQNNRLLYVRRTDVQINRYVVQPRHR